MDITSLQAAYTAGHLSPKRVIESVYDRIEAEGLRPVWISLVPRALAVAAAEALQLKDRASLPLYGVPFAVKDNIDIAGMVTTAACPAYAYTATESATVVSKLEAAGAILIGKTNMDQFATGLVGTRTPYGACSSVFNSSYISGGSSSGSAVAVANGTVSFALGTDTAGSGRIPAMFNNLIGLKPTRGVVSTDGVVPACRTLDCVSIFSETAHDASVVLGVISGLDAGDPYSRDAGVGTGATPWSGAKSFRFGVPDDDQLEFFGDPFNRGQYQAAIDALVAMGGEPVTTDLTPFLGAATLLYKGPWVSERYTAIAAFIQDNAAQMDPTVAGIIAGGAKYTAADAFKAAYQLAAYRQATTMIWSTIDVLVLPTAPRTYTIEEIRDSPIERNSQLGYYTNFVNLLDLAAVAVPCGLRMDGLPFGVSLIGRAFTELGLLPLADRLHRALSKHLGGTSRELATTPEIGTPSVPHACLMMAVVGAHLSGQPLNWQLVQRGGRLLRSCKTAPDYRFYALRNTTPAKPGLVRHPGYVGPGIDVEVWALPAHTVGTFVDGVPQPLSIGTLELEDGSKVKGFLVEPCAVEDSVEITQLGGWRQYLSSLPSRGE